MQLRVKYPRTPHLQYSPGVMSDDKMQEFPDCFDGKEIVITEKMDGECYCMYSDYIHARSVDGRHHPSRDFVKSFHGRIKHMIPVGDRVYGENMYARHSIAYNNLTSYVYGFGYVVGDLFLGYDETIEQLTQLGIALPAVWYRGNYDISKIHHIIQNIDTNTQEGFVIRNTDSFHVLDFANNVAKWVRPNHVQSEDHWMYSPIIPNTLQEK